MNLQGVEWPVFGLEDDVRPALKTLLESGQAAVLATLYRAEGGSPRGVGTQMLLGAEVVQGYLSGGCVEADVALHAERVIGDGRAKWLVYGQGGPADVRLPCGGRIEVLLERLSAEDAAASRLISLLQQRMPALWLSDGAERACLAPGESPSDLSANLQAAFRQAAHGGVCGPDDKGRSIFRRFDPAPRLVVIGADPPALAMAAMGAQVGFETTFVRPKGPQAPPPIHGVRYLRSSPSQALTEIGLDLWTSVAVATHDADLDEEALAAALASPAGYVGVLGSRRRLPERLQRLRALGLTDAAIARLKAPIGLALAGKSPWEIAVSVVGEAVQTLRLREETAGWPDVQRPAGQEDRGNLHALVFAAGQGSRYGGAKLVADWRGGVLLDGALAAAFAAPVVTVTVVTGAHAEQVSLAARAFAAARGEDVRLRIVHAADHARGLSASIRRGILSLPEDAQGAYLFLGDMPRAPVSVLAPLAAALTTGAKAAAPVYAGRRGHPVLASRALFADLAALEGDRGAGALLGALGPGLVLVEAPDDGVLFDVDEPGQLADNPGQAPERAAVL